MAANEQCVTFFRCQQCSQCELFEGKRCARTKKARVKIIQESNRISKKSLGRNRKGSAHIQRHAMQVHILTAHKHRISYFANDLPFLVKQDVDIQGWNKLATKRQQMMMMSRLPSLLLVSTYYCLEKQTQTNYCVPYNRNYLEGRTGTLWSTYPRYDWRRVGWRRLSVTGAADPGILKKFVSWATKTPEQSLLSFFKLTETNFLQFQWNTFLVFRPEWDFFPAFFTEFAREFLGTYRSISARTQLVRFVLWIFFGTDSFYTTGVHHFNQGDLPFFLFFQHTPGREIKYVATLHQFCPLFRFGFWLNSSWCSRCTISEPILSQEQIPLFL